MTGANWFTQFELKLQREDEKFVTEHLRFIMFILWVENVKFL